MKLASLKSKNPKARQGDLVVVSRNGKTAAFPKAPHCTTLLEALENWTETSPLLETMYQQLNDGTCTTAIALHLEQCVAPLMNAPGFYDGSAFLSHVVRARRSRGDEMPPSARITPLMYQGVSDKLLGWNAPIDIMDPANGGDFEGEVAVITTDVPKGTPTEQTGRYIALLTLFNDITFREIVKQEIETKFGFLQSKPNSAFAPFVVTPDELGGAWGKGRVELGLTVKLNGKVFGSPHGKEMNFSFSDLIAHACRTRPLSAGSIVGSGTFSNEDSSKGFACLVEKRYQEIIDTKAASTPWLQPGDRVEMDITVDGVSLFGPIDEDVVVSGIAR